MPLLETIIRHHIAQALFLGAGRHNPPADIIAEMAEEDAALERRIERLEKRAAALEAETNELREQIGRA